MRLYPFFLLICSFSCYAFEVQPMIAELKTSGSSSKLTYQVSNPDDKPTPLEVVIYKRDFNEGGQEVLIPAEQDFMLFPPQIEIPARGTQVFRAQYIGNSLEESTSYRIVFKQLPIAETDESSKISMLFHFATLVFVSPERSQAILAQSLDCNSTARCQLNIENTGNGVLDLSYSQLTSPDSPPIKWQDLKEQAGKTFLLPRQQITFNLEQFKNIKKPTTNLIFKTKNEI